MDDVGRTIRELRTGLGMTQAALADKVGIDKNSIARMERGKLGFQPSTLEAIANALGVHTSFIAVLAADESKVKQDPAKSSVLRHLKDSVQEFLKAERSIAD